MLIEIGEDIVAKAETGDAVALEVLQQLAIAYKYGKHLIFIPISLLVRICSISYLNKNVISIYKRLRNKASELGVLKQAISYSAIVTTIDPNNQNQLWVHPARHVAIELYEETHLLVENLLDSDFYKYVSTYYQNNHKLNKCHICFFPLQGGGTTIKNVYEKEIDLGQHLCLAIMDSDKNYPNDQYGSTSGELKQMHEEKEPFNCNYYRMKKVCEIENLIPLSIVQTYQKNDKKNIFQLSPKLALSFFDMKKGLRFCSIKNEAMYNYWESIFSDHEELKDKLKKCHQECLVEHKYEVSKDIKNTCPKSSNILDGFGSDLLKDLLHDVASIGKLKKVKPYELTEDQREEWENIGKLVFEWCCAGEKIRV